MKVIVVGAGSIGKRHIGNLLGLEMKLDVTVVDPSETLCSEIKRQFDVNTYLSIEAALGHQQYNVAFICSPNHLHIPQAITLAEARCHLFIEKPLSLYFEEAITLIPFIEKYGVEVMVGCNLRFHPGVMHMSNTLKDGLIGRPLYARAQFSHYLPNWRPGKDYKKTYSANKDQGGGVLLDDIHEPDYLCWMLGEVTRVSGSLQNIGDLNIDVEDVAEYTLWHGGRVYSQIHADYLRRDKSRGCELVGTEGTVVWKSHGKNPETVKVELFEANTNEWRTLFIDEAYDLNQQYVDEIEYFLKQIKKGQKLTSGLNEALSLISVLDSVKKASSTGQVQIRQIG